MSLTFRAYQPGDFDTLYAIDQVCYPSDIAYSKRTLQWFLNLPGAACVVAETSGAPVGFILAESDAGRGHIITLDVLEHARRRGIGTALLDTIEHTFAGRGVREVALETATNNEAAVAFWNKHGYRTVGVLKRYYSGRLDAYSMQKLLRVRKET